MHYFLLIAADRYHEAVAPALSAAWRTQSFAPVLELCRGLESAAREFVQQTPLGQTVPVVLQIAAGPVPFRRELWRLLAGEVLLFSATELPEIETPLETLSAVLGQPLAERREAFPEIQQCVFGTRDLAFGGAYYRPDRAGWNDVPDVERLAAWLEAESPADWQPADDSENAADELEFAREWFPSLVEMYRGAAERGFVVVCERV